MIAGVLAGGAVFTAIMIGVAGIAVGLGWLDTRGAATLDLEKWLILEIAAGVPGGVIAGAVSRKAGRVVRAPVALALGLFTLGWLEVAEVLRHVARGSVRAPISLLLLAPIVTAASVLAGGARIENLRDMLVRKWGLRRTPEVTRYVAPVTALLVMLALSLFAVPGVPEEQERRIVYAALTVDFTLGFPALVYVALVRSRRVPWLLLVPAFALGYVLATATIPGEHHSALATMRWFALPFELALVAYLVTRTRAAFRSATTSTGDFVTRLRRSARHVLGGRLAADIITTEIAILYYAFRWRRNSSDGETTFSMHHSTGYVAVVLGLAMAIAIEATAMHVLISRWNVTAAWVLSALSAYALVWMVGDYRAIVARPLNVTPTTLNIRLGLRWEADVPIAWIERVETLRGRVGKPTRDTLVAVLLGEPNVRVSFDRVVEFTGMYGRRRAVREVRLHVDDAEHYCAALALPPT
jgi:hypothetical protein